MEATRRPWLWCGVHWLSAQALWAPAGGVLACQTADAAGTEATCRSWLWCGVHWLSALVLGHRLGDELAARQLAAAGAEAMCRLWLWCVGLWLLGRTCSPADAEAEAMCSSWLWCRGHWFRGRARRQPGGARAVAKCRSWLWGVVHGLSAPVRRALAHGACLLDSLQMQGADAVCRSRLVPWALAQGTDVLARQLAGAGTEATCGSWLWCLGQWPMATLGLAHKSAADLLRCSAEGARRPNFARPKISGPSWLESARRRILYRPELITGEW